MLGTRRTIVKGTFQIKSMWQLGVLAFLVTAATVSPGLAAAPWATLQGGHYLVKRANDGDSFHVSVEGKEYIFRLYFVDAPETTPGFRDRVEGKANYSGVTADRVWQVGDLANQLRRGRRTEPFLWRPGGEEPAGRSRM